MTMVIDKSGYDHKRHSKYYSIIVVIIVLIMATFFGRYLANNILVKTKKEYFAQAKTITVNLRLEVRVGVLSAHLTAPQSVKSPEIRILKDGQIVRKASVDIVARDHRALMSGWHAYLCASSPDFKITNLELADVRIEALGGSSLTGVYKASPLGKNEPTTCVTVARANIGAGRGAFLLKPVLNIYSISPSKNNNIKQPNKQSIVFNFTIL